jgi:hypothetical protein
MRLGHQFSPKTISMKEQRSWGGGRVEVVKCEGIKKFGSAVTARGIGRKRVWKRFFEGPDGSSLRACIRGASRRL